MYIIHGSLQVLCMWYNITMQLHHKVNLLGQILIGKFILLLINISFGKCTMIHVITPIPGLGVRSSEANLAKLGQIWPQLDSCGGGSHRDEGVGSVNSDLTEVNMMDTDSLKQLEHF